MTVGVVVDSAAALPVEVAQRYAVRVVPLAISVGSDSYRDGEIPDRELLGRLDEGVTTSAPAPGEYLLACQELLAEGADGVVVVTVSSALSGSWAAARIAAQSDPERIRLVDSGSAAGAELLIALAAAEAAAAGGSLQQVAAAAEAAVPEVRLVGTLDSLDRLVASGRVPGLAGRAGRWLGVNPLFELSAGKVRPLRPAFSREAALGRVIEQWRANRDGASRCAVVGLHALAPEAAEALLSAVRAAADGALLEPLLVSAFGAAMVAHAGPGVVGLAWRWHR